MVIENGGHRHPEHSIPPFFPTQIVLSRALGASEAVQRVGPPCYILARGETEPKQVQCLQSGHNIQGVCLGDIWCMQVRLAQTYEDSGNTRWVIQRRKNIEVARTFQRICPLTGDDGVGPIWWVVAIRAVAAMRGVQICRSYGRVVGSLGMPVHQQHQRS
jgi:hypothetical protein